MFNFCVIQEIVCISENTRKIYISDVLESKSRKSEYINCLYNYTNYHSSCTIVYKYFKTREDAKILKDSIKCNANSIDMSLARTLDLMDMGEEFQRVA